jgi:hypothetical protein
MRVGEETEEGSRTPMGQDFNVAAKHLNTKTVRGPSLSSHLSMTDGFAKQAILDPDRRRSLPEGGCLSDRMLSGCGSFRCMLFVIGGREGRERSHSTGWILVKSQMPNRPKSYQMYSGCNLAWEGLYSS